MSSKFDREALRSFTFEEDRDLNPFFAGRTDIRRTIMEKCSIVTTRHITASSTSPPSGGMTQLIQGPPGIGKTSLLQKLRLDCMTHINQNPDGHHVIPVGPFGPDDLYDPSITDCIHDSVRDATRTLNARTVKMIIGDVSRIFASVGFQGFSIGLRASAKTVPSGCTILLMVDEIQTLDLINSGEPASLLRKLHLGSSRHPVLPVLAGLSNSRDVIDSIGISRPGSQAIHHMKEMNNDEMAQSMHLFIRRFGISGAHDLISERSKTIASWCHGWPKHLQNAMKALADELLLQDGNLARCDMTKIKRSFTDQKSEYYLTRFGEFRGRPALIGSLMARLGSEPVDLGTVDDAIAATMQDPLWQGKPVPEFKSMLRRGLLDESQSQPRPLYRCPIPSLQSFAVAQTGTSLHVNAACGLVDDVTQDLDQGNNVNARDAWGRTPLHLAVKDDWPQIMYLLIKAGADPNARDEKGRTPLHTATQENLPRASFDILFAAGADPNARDNRGQTALHLALQDDHAKIVPILIEAGTDMQIRDCMGRTAQDVASANSKSLGILSETTNLSGH